MICVVGASSRLGRAVVSLLLERGEAVRATARDPRTLADARARGAEVAGLDLGSGADPAPVLRGCAAVFASVHALTGRRADAIERIDVDGHLRLIDALAAAGVGRFVYTSVAGADAGAAHPFLRAKARVEAHLRASGLPFVVLRPGAFAESHAHMLIGARVAAGKRVLLVGTADLPANIVGVDDVAAAAVAVLRDDRWLGRSVEVLGPDTLTDRAVVAIYEEATGRPAKVSALSPTAARRLARAIRPVHAGVANVLTLRQAMPPPTLSDAGREEMRQLLGREPEPLQVLARRHLR